MINTQDALLFERADNAYDYLLERAECTKLEADLGSDDDIQGIEDFRSMLSLCKESIPTKRSEIAHELQTLYDYDITLKVHTDIHEKTKLFCHTIFVHKEHAYAIDDDYLNHFENDILLLNSIIDAFERRIAQIQSHKLLRFSKKNRELLLRLNKQLERFHLLKENLECSLTQVHHKMTAIIVTHFCHFYKFFKLLILYYENSANLFILIETAAMIDRLKKRLQAPLKSSALKKDQLKSNYALAELSQLQESIFRLI